jgi:hypothetical protein
MTDPTPTDWRALCAVLTDDLEEWVNGYLVNDPADQHTDASFELIDRVRAALAQPEPQVPTDEELMALAVAVFEDPFSTDKDYARAVLARWGRPAIEPVPVAERLPGPEDCDAEGRCWWWNVTMDPDSPNWWSLESIEYIETEPYWLPHHALPVPQQEAE